MRNNVYSDTFWYGDMFLPVWAKNGGGKKKKKKKIKISYTIYMKNCEGMTSSTRSFEYS